jgi:hypothetical protein
MNLVYPLIFVFVEKTLFISFFCFYNFTKNYFFPEGEDCLVLKNGLVGGTIVELALALPVTFGDVGETGIVGMIGPFGLGGITGLKLLKLNVGSGFATSLIFLSNQSAYCSKSEISSLFAISQNEPTLSLITIPFLENCSFN